jgi:FtsP/CotA-like multicopper oxidase with cupredoxin domain
MAGFALAYPVNVWMVSQKLRHGLMTDRKPGSHFAAKAPRKRSKTAAEDHSDHAGSGMQHGPAGSATRAQLFAVGCVSVLVLAIGMVAPANWVNLRLSSHNVGDAIMPPGMVMVRDTSAEAMRDMAAVLPRDVTHVRGLDAHGDTELEPRIENGVKVYDLETSVIRWQILPGVHVDGYAFNRQIPGPRQHFKQGDRVRINVTNHLPDTTTTHWHGLILPNE